MPPVWPLMSSCTACAESIITIMLSRSSAPMTLTSSLVFLIQHIKWVWRWCIRCHGVDYLVMLLVVFWVAENFYSDKGFEGKVVRIGWWPRDIFSQFWGINNMYLGMGGRGSYTCGVRVITNSIQTGEHTPPYTAQIIPSSPFLGQHTLTPRV